MYRSGEDAVVELLVALAARVEEMERRLGQNSSNSSRPPWSDPPQTPKRSGSGRSGRKRGGQPGHGGHHREMAANPDATVEHPPESCDGCGAGLADGEPVGEPVCHQVWELPAVVCLVTEHQRLRRRCKCWGKVTLADVPAGVPAGAFGPNLCATVVSLCAHMYGLRQLTDVTNKALSPGINDPTTAVHALGHSCALLCELSRHDLGPRLLRDQRGQVRVVLAQRGFADLLELAIAQPRRYGAGDPSVLGRLFELLRELAWCTEQSDHRRAVAEQLTRLRASAAAQDFDAAESTRLAELATQVEHAQAGRWTPASSTL